MTAPHPLRGGQEFEFLIIEIYLELGAWNLVLCGSRYDSDLRKEAIDYAAVRKDLHPYSCV
jgi:hypothetical protein